MTTRGNRRQQRNAELEAKIAELERKIGHYQRSSAFGCYTRAALEIDILPTFDTTGLTLVFLDIDHLKALNDRYGKAVRKNADQLCVNERISAAFAAMRSADVLIGQWFSGDEFIALVPDIDASGFASRLRFELGLYAITATFVIAPIWHTQPLIETINAADNTASWYKAQDKRNSIHDTRSTLQ